MRYNQIPMNIPDQEHTSFITDRGLYSYKMMPFGLKNVGVTYQRLVNWMLKEHIGKTIEVYVDDMFIKSLVSSDHVAHLPDTFRILRASRIKLNPLKCVFDVAFGKFLGFMVNQQSIEANLEKIPAVIDIRSPSKTKEV